MYFPPPDSAKQDHFRRDLASNLEVEPAQVEIVRFNAGSLVVDVEVHGLLSEGVAVEMAGRTLDEYEAFAARPDARPRAASAFLKRHSDALAADEARREAVQATRDRVAALLEEGPR